MQFQFPRSARHVTKIGQDPLDNRQRAFIFAGPGKHVRQPAIHHRKHETEAIASRLGNSPALFRSGPRQVGPDRRLLGRAKFSTKSRTAKTAVLVISRSFFGAFDRTGGIPAQEVHNRSHVMRERQGVWVTKILRQHERFRNPQKGFVCSGPGSTNPKIAAAAKPLGAPPCKGRIAAAFLCQLKA